jgi:hypothetical protein
LRHTLRGPGAGLAVLLLTAACGQQQPAEAPAAPNAQLVPRQAVLVGGWLSSGEAALEAVLPGPETAPAAGGAEGPYRLRGLDDRGETLFELAFGDADLAEVPGQPVRRFMLVAPVGAGGAEALAALELDAGPGRVVSRQAAGSQEDLAAALTGGEFVRLRNLPGDRVRVRWDPGRFAVLRLRDPVTGVVLALDRDGEVIVAAGDTLEVAVSDGVRSAAALFPLR